jgi:hypothetical protein
MEYWSVKIKKHQSFRHYSNTPVLQPVAPKSHLSVTKGDTSELIEVESSHGGLPYFLGYRSEKDHPAWLI